LRRKKVVVVFTVLREELGLEEEEEFG